MVKRVLAVAGLTDILVTVVDGVSVWMQGIGYVHLEVQ